MSMQDRRRNPRVPLSRVVSIEIAGGPLLIGQGEDLSFSGMAVLCRDNLAAGTQVTLSFQAGVQGLQEEIVMRAVARHSHVKNDQFCIGFEFTESGLRELNRIRELVNHKLAIHLAQHS